MSLLDCVFIVFTLHVFGELCVHNYTSLWKSLMSCVFMYFTLQVFGELWCSCTSLCTSLVNCVFIISTLHVLGELCVHYLHSARLGWTVCSLSSLCKSLVSCGELGVHKPCISSVTRVLLFLSAWLLICWQSIYRFLPGQCCFPTAVGSLAFTHLKHPQSDEEGDGSEGHVL